MASIEAFSYPQTNSNLNDFLLSDESLRIWYLQRPEEWANLSSEDGSREHGLVGKTWRRGAKLLIGKAGSCPWEIPFMEIHFLVRFSVAPGLRGSRWKGICSHLGGKLSLDAHSRHSKIISSHLGQSSEASGGMIGG